MPTANTPQPLAVRARAVFFWEIGHLHRGTASKAALKAWLQLPHTHTRRHTHTHSVAVLHLPLIQIEFIL